MAVKHRRTPMSRSEWSRPGRKAYDAEQVGRANVDEPSSSGSIATSAVAHRRRSPLTLGHFGRMLRFLTIMLVAVAMTGCCCLHDARGPSSTCEVHLTAMKSTTAPGWGGCALPTIQYAEARTKLFPNAGGDYIASPWPWKRQRVYICDDSVRAKDEWSKNH